MSHYAMQVLTLAFVTVAAVCNLAFAIIQFRRRR